MINEEEEAAVEATEVAEVALEAVVAAEEASVDAAVAAVVGLKDPLLMSRPSLTSLTPAKVRSSASCKESESLF